MSDAQIMEVARSRRLAMAAMSGRDVVSDKRARTSSNHRSRYASMGDDVTDNAAADSAHDGAGRRVTGWTVAMRGGARGKWLNRQQYQQHGGERSDLPLQHLGLPVDDRSQSDLGRKVKI